MNKNKNELETLASGSSVTFFYRILSRILLVGIQILIARFFGPAIFGLYAIGWIISRMVWSFSTLGLQNGVTKYSIKYLDKDDASFKGIVFNALTLSFFLGVIMMLIFFFGAEWIANHVYKNAELANIIKLFSLSFPFLSLLTITSSLSRISLKMEYGTIAEDFLPQIISLIVLIILYYLGLGIYSAVISTVLGYFIAFLVSIYFLYKLFPVLFDWSIRPNNRYKELLLFSLPTFLSVTFSFLTNRLSALILGAYVPTSSVGVYQAASQNIVSAGIIPSSLRIIFSPLIARLIEDNKIEEVKKIYKTSTRWVLYMNLPIFLIFWLVPSELIVVLFGKPYVAGAAILGILSVGQLVNTASGAVGQLMIMTEHQKQWMWMSIGALVVNIILCFLLIPTEGLKGAAITVSSVNAILPILGVIYTKKKLNMAPYDYKIWKGIIAFTITFIMLYLALNYTIIQDQYPIIRLSFVASLGTSCFFLLLYKLGLDAEDQQVIGLVMSKIKKKKNKK